MYLKAIPFQGSERKGLTALPHFEHLSYAVVLGEVPYSVPYLVDTLT